MNRLVIFCVLIFMGIGAASQSNRASESMKPNNNIVTLDIAKTDSLRLLHLEMLLRDTVKIQIDTTKAEHQRMIFPADSLTMSDYTLGMERVNENLNAIADSAKLRFEVVKLARKIGRMTEDIQQIRENIRVRNAVFNIKNQYLYLSFTARLVEETDKVQVRLDRLYNRVHYAKQNMRVALSDTVFRKLYADRKLRTIFDQNLVRLERKWNRTDSTTRANVDSLNSLKVRLSDNSMNLSSIANILDYRMDKAVPKLFGPEVNYLWKKDTIETPVQETSTYAISIFDGEQRAIGYYITQTSGERKLVVILGVLLFYWLYLKRKLLKIISRPKHPYRYLNFIYLNNFPILSLFVVLLSLMPFFDAYAPTSYISVLYIILLILTTVIFFKKGDRTFLVNWLALVILFIANVLTYLLIEPTFFERLILLGIHAGIIGFIIRFYKSLDKQMDYYRFIRIAAISGILLSGMGILFNLAGRFSLAGIVGMAGIFAVTQAVVLIVFVEIIVEIILLQLQSSRLNKGIDKPFDSESVIKKFKMPLTITAILIWLIMLTSNLNVYHSINEAITDSLTLTRTIGSISFQLISVILFFVIIWCAHILQRLLSFYFGETGIDTEDVTPITKGHHARLLVTRLLVLIGGYLLAIAASGLPIDKLTFLLGALGIGIGLGLQSIVNNFVSGIILIFDGSLQIGDEIETSGQSGRVKEIGLRASTLTTADGADVIIPNGIILSQNIVNWTFSNTEKRIVLSCTLSGKELDANIINEVINTTIKNIPNVTEKRNPIILYTKVTAQTCVVSIRFWSVVNHVDLIQSEAMIQLNAAFAAKNIGFE